MSFKEQLAELERYASLDGSEWGEAASLLIHLYSRRDFLTYDMQIALQNEIIQFWEDAKKGATIVTYETTHVSTNTDLEWK